MTLACYGVYSGFCCGSLTLHNLSTYLPTANFDKFLREESNKLPSLGQIDTGQKAVVRGTGSYHRTMAT